MRKFLGLLCSLFLFSAAWASDAMSVVHHFDLRNCSKSKCVKVEAVKAETGSFSPLLSLKQVEVTITQGKSKKHYIAPYGFLDLDNQRAVFRLSPKEEMSLNLNNIETERFRL